MRDFWPLVLGVVLLAGRPGVGQAACAVPDITPLVEGAPAMFVKVRSAWTRSPGPRLHWLAVSIGHSQGAIYVFDCKGRKRGELGLGEIESVKPGPIVAHLPTAVVTHHDSYGFDFEEVNVALLQYRAGRVVSLWDHLLFHHDFPPKDPGSQQKTTFRWRAVRNASQIELSGREVKGDPPRVRVRRLRPERYCFDQASVKYLSCDRRR